MKSIFVLCLLVFSGLLNIKSPVLAVVIARDTVILYENGVRIIDSSVMYDKYNYAPSCKQGICEIQQGYGQITFYKTNSANVLDYEEWCTLYECRSAPHNEYLDKLKGSSLYSSVITIPPSQGGKGCGYPGCMGGRIGTSRTFRYDLKTKELELISTQSSGFPINPIYLGIGLTLFAMAIFHTVKKYKSLQHSSK